MLEVLDLSHRCVRQNHCSVTDRVQRVLLRRSGSRGARLGRDQGIRSENAQCVTQGLLRELTCRIFSFKLFMYSSSVSPPPPVYRCPGNGHEGARRWNDSRDFGLRVHF